MNKNKINGKNISYINIIHAIIVITLYQSYDINFHLIIIVWT